MLPFHAQTGVFLHLLYPAAQAEEPPALPAGWTRTGLFLLLFVETPYND